MINDLKPVLSSNILVKFADSSEMEVKNVIQWVDTNRMELNFKKSWEMVMTWKNITSTSRSTTYDIP